MDLEQFERAERQSAARGVIVSEAFPAVMRKVYVWMTLALVITGFTAYAVAHTPALMQLIFGSKLVFFGLIIAELALVIGVTAAIGRLGLTAATMLFALYSAVNGATLASIFVVFTEASIANVFFITAGTFAVTAFYGYTTRRDLSRLGSLLIMAVLGLIIATLVNAFLIHSSGFDLIVSYIGVLVFVGLTAYDTQKIKQLLYESDGSETTYKLALLGALSLYLDFINLFLYLLRIFGNRNN